MAALARNRKAGTMRIAVAVIDDYDIIRLGVQSLLAEDATLDFVGGYPTLDAFCYSPMIAGLDVVILDDTLPHTRPSDAVRRVQTVAPDAGLLVLGSTLTPRRIHGLLRLGVAGFVCKDEPLRDTLLTGIRRVHQGKPHFSPEAALISRETEPLLPLSPRLMQVLKLTDKGLPIPEIAVVLGTSTDAVYQARTRLRNALDAHTDAQLIAEARRRGLIDAEP